MYFAFGSMPTHSFLTENELTEAGNTANQLYAFTTQDPELWVYTDLEKASILPTSSYPRQVGFDLTIVKLHILGKEVEYRKSHLGSSI